MQEATRLQYLALLGITQWRLRDDPRHAATVVADAPSMPPAAALVPQRDAASPPEAVGRRAGPAARPEEAGAAANGPRSVAQGLRIGCAFLELPGGLLLAAAYADPAAPGLGEAEHTLLRNIAAALAPEHALPAPDEFNWPPRGARVPGMDRPGAAETALQEFLARYRRRGLRDLAVFDEALCAVLRPFCERHGLLAPIGLPSLAAMNAQADLKRECWARLRPLKRNPPA